MTEYAVCRAGQRKEAFTDVILCKFKLRKLESMYRGNATIDAYVGELYSIACYKYCGMSLIIILLGVGWLRCLSLHRGNAKAWT